MSRRVVTGATGTVGAELVRRLLGDGHQPVVVVRDPLAAPALRAAGAEVVVADLEVEGAWQAQLHGADMVWHLGLPRLSPPLRRRGAERDAARAAAAAGNLRRAVGDAPVVLASHVVASVAPELRLAGAVRSAERALAHPELRVVRLGWGYGPEGFVAAMVRGLAQGRYRIVGAGENRMPLIAPEDAVTALLAAGGLDPGVVVAAEDTIPTQLELVHAACAAIGATRPDRLPPRMAALSFGGALVAALTASASADTAALTAAGWAPVRDWRTDLVGISRGGVASAAG